MSKGNRTRRRDAGLLPPPVRCKAHKKNGEPCKKYAVNGAAVCEKHGGNAPQVRRKAEQRLAMHADVLMKELVKIATSAESEAVRLAAVRDALDRIGIGSRQEIEVTIAKWQEDIEGVLVDVDESAEVVVAELVVDDPPRALPSRQGWDGRTGDNVPPTYTRGAVARRGP